MNTPIMIQVLCGSSERHSWVAPGLVSALLAATQDGQRHQRGVGVGLTCDVRPVATARYVVVEQFLKSACHWVVMCDNDVVPQFRILDLIACAEAAGKHFVAAPTPIYSPQRGGLTWNCTKTGKDDFFYGALPQGWFSPFLCGAGFIACDRKVFEGMKAPYFEMPYEDFAFSVRAADAGFKPWARHDFVADHLHTFPMLSMMPR